VPDATIAGGGGLGAKPSSLSQVLHSGAKKRKGRCVQPKEIKAMSLGLILVILLIIFLLGGFSGRFGGYGYGYGHGGVGIIGIILIIVVVLMLLGRL
jgi:cation transporter-like permease